VLKAGTMRGCLVNNQNLNLRGLNPLFLSFVFFNLKRELERELERKGGEDWRWLCEDQVFGSSISSQGM
jgi:hypothetical protein